jgi:hypothetical protein
MIGGGGLLWFVLCWVGEGKDEGVEDIRFATFLQMVCRGAAHHKDATGTIFEL